MTEGFAWRRELAKGILRQGRECCFLSVFPTPRLVHKSFGRLRLRSAWPLFMRTAAEGGMASAEKR